MKNTIKKPQVGDIVFVREGERIINPSNANERHLNTRFISKDYGRIIMFNSTKSNPIHKGFVKLESIHENRNSYTAVGSNVPYDYYYGITVDEFYQVLEVWGFTLEYETIIKDNTKFRVFAHLEKGLLLTCEEYGFLDLLFWDLVALRYMFQIHLKNSIQCLLLKFIILK